VGIPYPVLVLPHVKRLSPDTLRALIRYVDRGGKIIAAGSVPAYAPGFVHADEVKTQVQSLSQALFAGNAGTQVVANDTDLGAALHRILEPDMALTGDSGNIGFLHRKLDDADIYFIANTSNHVVHATAAFRAHRIAASWWDSFTGTSHAIEGTPAELNLEPYESRVLVFSDKPAPVPRPAHFASTHMIADLTHDWEVRFPGSDNGTPITQHLDRLSSWTNDPREHFFSGTAVYTKTISLDEADLTGTGTVLIDFGKGTPVEADPAIKNGMSALLESPVREVAVVRVNGERVGSIWHPPYTLEVTAHLHPGENQIEILIANTAINELAGQSAPDYRLLNARYGQRFVPQDMENLEPLPSGILGSVQLLGTR